MKEKIKKEIEEITEDVFEKKMKVKLEIPPKIEMGDFAIPCFEFAKKINESPSEVAKKIKNNFSPFSFIKEIKIAGPYLNFVINKKFLFEKTIKEILEEDSFLPKLKEERIMIEFVSPNNNKQLHLGHVRNACLGNSIANILEDCGKKVTRTCLINDKGKPIFKNILAWSKWHKKETPQDLDKKPDHYLGELYVEYEKKKKSNPELKKEVQKLMQKWEENDKKVVEKWKILNDWFLKGFKESMGKLDINFDLIQKESNLYKKGRKIIKKGLKEDIFKKDEKGNIIIPLPEDKFGLNPEGDPKVALLLREDGTSVYLTQDIGVAVERFKKYNLDQLIYVVGSEQKEHFQKLFTVLNLLGYKWSKNCIHLPYGLVDLPEGGMSSRKGNIVSLDELVEEIMELANKEIEKRHSLSEIKQKERANKIMQAAIKFYLLKVSASKNLQFNPEKSISFEGTTRPCCQYAYARIQSILRKSDKEIELSKIDFSVLTKKEEIELLRELIKFPQSVEIAAEKLDPSFVADQTYKIAQAFNSFYNKHSVLFSDDEKKESARLALSKVSGKVIKKGLSLLGIKVLKKM